MINKMIFIAILILTGVIVTSDLQAAEEHPFLICKRSQFAELRERAEREPWATMKAEAFAAVEKEVDASDPVELHRYIGAAALVYILDEGNEVANARRVRDAILKLEQVEFDPSKAWAGTVRQMGVSFVCILALDVVYDDLSKEDIAKCETLIEKKINQIDRTGSWPAARYGTHGTWDIYKGVRTTPDDAFYANYVRQMTDDGVSTVSPGYSFARLGSGDDRLQKTCYADVLEFTGIDRRYYNNERLQRYYRWLFSACVTPAREYHMFGDVSPRWGSSRGMLLWRVGRFDEKAAGYAAWYLDGKTPPGHFVIYILMTEPLPEPVVPQSQLFMTGAAVFREKADSPESLGGMLYNIDSNAEWHSHEEVNAISCAAYGNRLLTNGGWLGDDMRPPYKNNTLAINGERHATKTGNGLVEGLLGDGFDYACGDSGEALGDGKSFQRSLMLVHGQEDVNGYFAVIDEVDAQADDKIHSYLQLASETQAMEVADKQEYEAAINHHAKVDGVKMSVFYATKPISVEQSLVESGFLQRDPESGHHYRLEAIYPVDSNGKRQIVTLLFPQNADHRKAQMVCFDQVGLSGVEVNHDEGIHDFIAAIDESSRIEVSGLSIHAKACMVRRQQDEVLFYFVRQGKGLLVGDIGFESSRPISLYMKGKRGQVTSEGADVVFYYPGVQSVHVDGKPVMFFEAGVGRVRVTVPEGRHRISLE